MKIFINKTPLIVALLPLGLSDEPSMQGFFYYGIL